MRSLLLASALALSSAAALAAQEPVARDTTEPLLLPGLTVSVLRTPIEVNRAPFATSVTTQEEIQRARPGLGLDEALRAVPGVQVDNRYNYALGERISIRGFGARSQFGVRGIRVLVDGVPATFPDGQSSLSHVDLGFLRRVEVIRGPASSLYGGNTGGVVQFETEAAPQRVFSQEVGLTAGSDGLFRVQSTSGGRSGNGSYLLNLSRMDYDGYRTHNSAENTHLDARFGWLGARDELRLSVSAVDYDAQNPGSLSAALLETQRNEAFANNVRNRTGESGQQGQFGLTWRRDLGFGVGELVGYGIAREVDNPIPGTIVVLDRKVGGLRGLFSAGGPALSWAAGGEASAQWDDRQNYANEEGDRGTLTLDQRERVSNVGAFAQVNAIPLPRLTLLGALRYDWYRFRADDDLVTATDPDDSGRVPMEHFSPSVGLSYEVADALNLYANVATSFETPTTTELANRPTGAGGFNPDLEPQEAISYEIGAKASLGPWARYELAAYRSDVTNALIPFELPDDPDGRTFFRNAGSTVHRGVEAGLVLAPISALHFRAAYTYTDARFEEYVVDGDDFADNKLPGVAPHRVEGVLSAHSDGGLFASLEGRYASRIPVNDANSAHSPSYVVFDARAGLEGVRVAGLEFEPFAGVTNLLDKEYNTSVAINAFGMRYFEPAPGRSFYLGASARLGWD